MHTKPILLIGFYNPKALGVRCLEKALSAAGFNPYILFFKDFSSIRPEPATGTELKLLKDLVVLLEPGLIGLSVMSSLYLETVVVVNEMLRKNFDIPIAWGGVYASLFPEKSLLHADFVIRGEGEEAVVDLADAVLNGKPHGGIRNLAYTVRGENSAGGPGLAVINELRPLREDLDSLGYPLFTSRNKFFINGGRLFHGDPLANSAAYELAASRGCPFSCSYCSSVSLRRMYAGKGKFVRVRSVSGVIGELEEAMVFMKKIKTVHFWDEIFPDDSEWIDEFSEQYRAKIKLPFEIWGHPLRTSEHAVSKLAGAGLYKVVVGIQSGSPEIRKNIFRRNESQADILEAGRILARQKVPHVIYDFMLKHPFETEDDMRMTYELCTMLARPFELQLHGLHFLPGTDIVEIGAKRGLPGLNSQDSGIEEPMNEQYNSYWGKKSGGAAKDFWQSLIYATQFGTGVKLSGLLSRFPKSRTAVFLALMLPKLYFPAAILRRLHKKAAMLARALAAKMRRAILMAEEFQYGEGK